MHVKSPLRRAAATLSVVVVAALALAAGEAVGATSPGLAVFKSSGCGACHTFAAAKAKGKVGPNLDRLSFTSAVVVKQVTRGGGGMPPFGSRLSKAQIKAVALFVSANAGKKR
jgi:mono/diheme cytochrome c family protein